MLLIIAYMHKEFIEAGIIVLGELDMCHEVLLTDSTILV